MYAVIRAYAGNSELADTLVEHEGDIRQVIGRIDGFKGYYLLSSPRELPRSASSRIGRARRSQAALPPHGWPRTCQN
jgi:hypothetical protein